MTVWCIFSATVPGLRASATTTWSRTAQIGAASTSPSFISPRLLRICIAKRARVPYDAERERPTRDLLHVAGRLPHGDTLDVFVVHFPSRRGGAAASEPYRLRAAQLLREMADSIAHLRHRPLLLAMGDFNDEPQNRSIREVLSPTFIALTPHATPLPAEGHEDTRRHVLFSR